MAGQPQVGLSSIPGSPIKEGDERPSDRSLWICVPNENNPFKWALLPVISLVSMKYIPYCIKNMFNRQMNYLMTFYQVLKI